MSNAPAQIPLPSVAQHLRELAQRRGAWLAPFKNAIPVVGIYFLHWSVALAVFSYWFDGITAIMGMVTALIPRALRETKKPTDTTSPIKRALQLVIGWPLLVGIIGLPYWILLMPLSELFSGGDLRQQFAQTPLLWVTFGMVAFGNFWKSFHEHFDTLPDDALTQQVRWGFYLLLIRAIVMFFIASPGLTFILVPALAVVLTYLDIWPDHALGALFGDSSRLYQFKPGDKSDRL